MEMTMTLRGCGISRCPSLPKVMKVEILHGKLLDLMVPASGGRPLIYSSSKELCGSTGAVSGKGRKSDSRGEEQRLARGKSSMIIQMVEQSHSPLPMNVSVSGGEHVAHLNLMGR